MMMKKPMPMSPAMDTTMPPAMPMPPMKAPMSKKPMAKKSAKKPMKRGK